MPEFLKERGTLLIVLLIGTAFTFFWLTKNRETLRFRWWQTLMLSLGHTIIGVASVLLFGFLERIGTNPTFGTMSLYGAIFFLPIFYALLAKLSKRRFADVFDVFTVCMGFTLFCARFNCILTGCCRGAPIAGTQLLWPTREIELLFYIVILAIFMLRTHKQKNHGELYPLYMICYGAFRFILEFFREHDTTNALHLAHLWSVIALCLGMSIYFEIQRKTVKKTMSGGKRKK